MKLGPVMYSKEEETIIGRSFLLGMIFGVPLGVFVNFVLGFPTIPEQMPTGLFDQFIMFTLLLTSILGFWWLLSTALSFIFYNAKALTLSWRNIGRILFAMLTIPYIIIFVPFVYSAFFVPMYGLLYPSLPILLVRTLGFILFLPFVLVFIAIVMPESKARKSINRLFRRLKKKS